MYIFCQYLPRVATRTYLLRVLIAAIEVHVLVRGSYLSALKEEGKKTDAHVHLIQLKMISIHQHNNRLCIPVETGSSIVTSRSVQQAMQDSYA